MHHALGEFDDRTDELGLIGDDRGDEFSRPERRLPTLLLSLGAMALFAGGLWFAYVQGTHHPAVNASSDKVPLIRADDHPTKVRPDQPGGMPVPDQNVSIYNEKPGGPTVEKLLPAAEQPMPRPAPAPPSTAPAANPQVVIEPTSPVTTAPIADHPPAPPAAVKGHQPAPVSHAKTAAVAPPPATGKQGPIRVQLGSLHSAEAARAEWARLKHEQPDLLGKLTAVAVRADLGDKGIYYRIEAGAFGNPADASRLCGELKRRKLGCALAR